MKELTTEIKLTMTLIEKMEDDEVEKCILNDGTEESKRELAAALKESLGIDKVDVTKVKHFVMDVKEPTEE